MVHDIVKDILVQACLIAQLSLIVGIGQKAHIKDQVCIQRQTVFETKTHDFNTETVHLVLIWELLRDGLSELPWCQICCVHNILAKILQRG